MVSRMTALHLASLCKALQPSHLEHHLLQLVGKLYSAEEEESPLGRTLREDSPLVVLIVEADHDVTQEVVQEAERQGRTLVMVSVAGDKRVEL